MIQTQNRNQQDDHGFVHVGRTLNYAAREISCALDAYISTRVSPELTGMRGMVLGFLMQETESGKQIYQRDLEARFHTNRSSITTMLQGMEQSGFITREVVAKDARLKSLVPTEKGRQCAAAIHQCISDFEHDLQNGVSAQELEAIQNFLSRQYEGGIFDTSRIRTYSVEEGEVVFDFSVDTKEKFSQKEVQCETQKKYEITSIAHPQFPWLHRIRAW